MPYSVLFYALCDVRYCPKHCVMPSTDLGSIALCARYAVSGTDVAYGPTRLRPSRLDAGICLRARYEVPGTDLVTDLAYGDSIFLGLRYANPGTELVYGATGAMARGLDPRSESSQVTAAICLRASYTMSGTVIAYGGGLYLSTRSLSVVASGEPANLPMHTACSVGGTDLAYRATGVYRQWCVQSSDGELRYLPTRSLCNARESACHARMDRPHRYKLRCDVRIQEATISAIVAVA
eukprot:1869298-Rhodomonas_salina.1